MPLKILSLTLRGGRIFTRPRAPDIFLHDFDHFCTKFKRLERRKFKLGVRKSTSMDETIQDECSQEDPSKNGEKLLDDPRARA